MTVAYQPASSVQAPLKVRSARTLEADPFRAAQQLALELDANAASAALLFCDENYDLNQLGVAIKRAFACPVVACTSAGQLGAGGFTSGGISGVALGGADLHMQPLLVAPIASGEAQLNQALREALPVRPAGRRLRGFGVLLSDGVAGVEELLAASIYRAIGNVPLVGGSATDAAFEGARVYYDGRFLANAAVLALFETELLPFATFRAQFFRAGERRLVTTLADPDERLIYELDGEPAAAAYARMLGLPQSRLDATTLARNPLVLSVGERSYVRSLRAVNPDGSLSLHCAIEEGLVLSIGEPVEPIPALEQALAGLPPEVADAPLLLGFDSACDRRELAARGRADAVSSWLAQHRLHGFSGYGSQLGPIHFNQCLTGIALGHARTERR